MYIKRELSKSLSTFISLQFTPRVKKKSLKRYSVTVGIGANLGDSKRRFEHLLVFLQKDKRVDVRQTSLILKNPPFGFLNQDDFFNSIIVLQVDMQPRVFLDYLQRLERKFGRRRSFANAPRTLDLDIIFFEDRVIKTDRLTIPHFDWLNRESVTIPLAGMR